jgi:recombination protein RecA
MATLARAELESLLRARKLDRTLSTALPVAVPGDDHALAPTGLAALEEALGGGFPRGQLSELIGPASSGRTSVVLHALAAATRRGELVALVDGLDTFDVESAAAAGLDLDRLLWVRGHVVPNPGLCRDLNQRALEQAVRALSLILQSGHFGLVVFDVAGVPGEVLRRLPFTTWLRLQRMVEGSQTSCVLLGSEGMARSSAGVTVRLGVRPSGARGMARFDGHARMGEAPPLPSHTRLLGGLAFDVRVARARAHGADGRQWPVETRMVEEADVQPVRRAASARAR